MTTLARLTLYFLFAAMAISLNVAVQTLVFVFWESPYTIHVAMVLGAGVALLVKYLLDRQFVFKVTEPAAPGEFSRYALTGGLITAVFFVVEYTIWILFQTDLARNIGIVVGMLIGYTLKYILDQKFTFASSHGD